MPNLTHLALKGGDLTEEFYSTLKAKAPFIQVQTLDLTKHQCPTPASSHHLSEALCSMPHLTDLTLDGGDLREEFYSTWKANAPSMKVQTLNLTNHEVPTPASSHHLSEALCSMPHLTDLRLYEGDLREEFYSTLKAKASSIKVQTLDLTNHQCPTPSSSHHLSEALCSMPHLTDLRLYEGDLREEFYSTLKAKASSIKVQTLNLTNHQCPTPSSSHHLSEALCSMPHLTDLTLDGGDLREEFYSKLKAKASSIKACALSFTDVLVITESWLSGDSERDGLILADLRSGSQEAKASCGTSFDQVWTFDRELYRRECESYYECIFNAKSAYLKDLIKNADTKELFRLVKTLSTPTQSSPLPDHSSDSELANRFATFFREKVAKVVSSFPNVVPAPASRSFAPGPRHELSDFCLVSLSQVRKLITSLPSKHCKLDPIPTWLLKEVLDELLPHITKLFNLSLSSGIVPESFKTSLLLPLLKKPSLDTNRLKNYRPIANLPFLGKVLERIVSLQLKAHIDNLGLFPIHQSAYRNHHSTETATVKVLNDLLLAVDKGNEAVLILLDYIAAFDTINHDLLLHRLENDFSIPGTVLQWIRSYLMHRTRR
ncbi:uncharacterized protein LOC115921340 [Strongylocentrotus purpuratus]|uniref:Reverse transcriptase domain-containing protein n=1 Tax=Strongylocentrotus purpuratus TaxID=7668 RepID=A0A7M7NF04_STRPU|nr:uncharacterized protein LOC115921340 [Strongylocentrotus purpuratus]